jgi:hypothetical protein
MAEGQRPADWPKLMAACEEFMLSDVLVRVWLGWLRTQPLGDEFWQEWEAVASAVRQMHDDVRHRFLKFLIIAADSPTGEVAWLDRVRRRAERWTDLLLGQLRMDEHCPANLDELAFGCAESMMTAAADDACEANQQQSATDQVYGAWQRIYGTALTGAALNGPANRRLVCAILRAVGVWDGRVVCQLADFWEDRMTVGADELAEWLYHCDDTLPRPWPSTAQR